MDAHAEAEGPVWVGHPSHWHYFGRWLLALLLLGGAAYGAVATRGSVDVPDWAWLAAVAVAIILILTVFFARAARTYTVTPTKVIIELGLVAKNSDELRIKDIRSIAVNRSGLAGLFGIGTIEFSSAAAADADIVYRSVPNVNGVRDIVRRYQENV